MAVRTLRKLRCQLLKLQTSSLQPRSREEERKQNILWVVAVLAALV